MEAGNPTLHSADQVQFRCICLGAISVGGKSCRSSHSRTTASRIRGFQTKQPLVTCCTSRRAWARVLELTISGKHYTSVKTFFDLQGELQAKHFEIQKPYFLMMLSVKKFREEEQEFGAILC